MANQSTSAPYASCMIETNISLRAWRVVTAFMVAPTLAAFVLACYMPLYAGLPDLMDRVLRTTATFCLFYAYPVTVLLGVPSFFLLRTRVRPTILHCAFTGSAVVALPWLLLVLLSEAPDYAMVGNRVTAIDGQTTMWGWIELAKSITLIGAAGALGGAVFWIVAAAGLTRKPLGSA